jgi:Ca2+-binding RTX toxin-like protein
VTVNLAAAAGARGEAAGDTYSSIENVAGTNFDDVLVGDASDNTLWGFDGIDVLYGNDGADTLRSGAGNDTLISGAGADIVDGGDGNDTAYYFYASSAVSVKLAAGSGSLGEALGDTYSSIENVAGTNFADTLIGDSFANTLSGFDGIDRLTGGGGSDILSGGAGADRFVYNTAAFGNDKVTDYLDGTDKLEISTAIAANFAAIGVTQLSVTSVLLSFASGTVQLDSSSAITMGASDFIFV